MAALPKDKSQWSSTCHLQVEGTCHPRNLVNWETRLVFCLPILFAEVPFGRPRGGIGKAKKATFHKNKAMTLRFPMCTGGCSVPAYQVGDAEPLLMLQ